MGRPSRFVTAPSGCSLVEATGRRSGQKRRAPRTPMWPPPMSRTGDGTRSRTLPRMDPAVGPCADGRNSDLNARGTLPAR